MKKLFKKTWSITWKVILVFLALMLFRVGGEWRYIQETEDEIEKAMSYMAEKHYQQSEDILQELVNETQQTMRSRLVYTQSIKTLCHTQLLSEKYKKAISNCEKGLRFLDRHYPNDSIQKFEILNLLGMVYFKIENRGELGKILKDIDNTHLKITEHPEKLIYLYVSAAKLHAYNDSEKLAKKYYKRALRMSLKHRGASDSLTQEIKDLLYNTDLES